MSRVELNDNRIADVFVNSRRPLPAVFGVGGNGLSGPWNWERMRLVKGIRTELNISHNQLSGEVQWATLADLDSIDLRHNDFAGTVDWRSAARIARVQHKPAIRSLSLGFFSREPDLPTIIAINNNKFVGSVDWSRFSEVNMRVNGVRLQHNQLSGTIDFDPIFNFHRPTLREVDVSQNNFTGRVNLKFIPSRVVRLNIVQSHREALCFTEFEGLKMKIRRAAAAPTLDWSSPTFINPQHHFDTDLSEDFLDDHLCPCSSSQMPTSLHHCKTCNAGTEIDSDEGVRCTPCRVGFFNNVAGGVCLPCPDGAQSNSERTQCLRVSALPEGTKSISESAGSISTVSLNPGSALQAQRLGLLSPECPPELADKPRFDMAPFKFAIGSSDAAQYTGGLIINVLIFVGLVDAHFAGICIWIVCTRRRGSRAPVSEPFGVALDRGVHMGKLSTIFSVLFVVLAEPLGHLTLVMLLIGDGLDQFIAVVILLLWLATAIAQYYLVLISNRNFVATMHPVEEVRLLEKNFVVRQFLPAAEWMVDGKDVELLADRSTTIPKGSPTWFMSLGAPIFVDYSVRFRQWMMFEAFLAFALGVNEAVTPFMGCIGGTIMLVLLLLMHTVITFWRRPFLVPLEKYMLFLCSPLMTFVGILKLVFVIEEDDTLADVMEFTLVGISVLLLIYSVLGIINLLRKLVGKARCCCDASPLSWLRFRERTPPEHEATLQVKSKSTIVDALPPVPSTSEERGVPSSTTPADQYVDIIKARTYNNNSNNTFVGVLSLPSRENSDLLAPPQPAEANSDLQGIVAAPPRPVAAAANPNLGILAAVAQVPRKAKPALTQPKRRIAKKTIAAMQKPAPPRPPPDDDDAGIYDMFSGVGVDNVGFQNVFEQLRLQRGAEGGKRKNPLERVGVSDGGGLVIAPTFEPLSPSPEREDTMLNFL